MRTEVECMIWCRDGSICQNATPCSKLLCKHKAKADEVLKGVRGCVHYQVTTVNESWEWAHHLSNDLSKIVTT